MRPQKDSGADRLIQMLATAMGEVGDLLLDETIVELMLNPDGRLWQDRLGEGRRFTGYTVSPADMMNEFLKQCRRRTVSSRVSSWSNGG